MSIYLAVGNWGLTIQVECTGSGEVFNGFKALFEPHLPLRNLHWKSATRPGPLRSIDTLHISLTQAEDRTARTASPRRHQIPGLRQTPFVKIYLLRCDDNERYKEVARKQARQWIKEVTGTSESKISQTTHERHDAFEWLIVHLVYPGTTAATQGRISKKSALGTTDSSDSAGSKTKWSGKSSSTLYEKLRADFSGSSKNALDRVAQLQIRGNGSPESGNANSTQPTQWDEFSDIVKAATLAAFSSRVAQYEEDTKEREAQRHLPGWNFCTFFILKEGLAQAFDKIGLLNDASAVYGELALGLDTVIREETNRRADQDNALLSFSKDLKSRIRDALDKLRDFGNPGTTNSTVGNFTKLIGFGKENFPFRDRLLDYRERILANEVSPLDFRIYLFIRQLEILQKQAKRSVPSETGAQNLKTRSTQEKLSPVIASEICEKGNRFITLAALCMRTELYMAWGGQEGQSAEERQVQSVVISNIVDNWTWHAVTHLLDLTEVAALSEFALPSVLRGLQLWSASLDPGAKGQTNDQGQYKDQVDELVKTENTYSHLIPGRPAVETTIGEARGLGSPDSYNDLEMLAFWRGQLILKLRDLARNASPKPPVDPRTENYETFVMGETAESSSDIHDPGESESDLAFHPGAGFDQGILRHVSISKESAIQATVILTEAAISQFIVAKKTKLICKCLCDLGHCYYLHQQYRKAVDVLEIVFRSQIESWDSSLVRVLGLYSESLKNLDEGEKYLKSLFRLFSVSRLHVKSSNDVFPSSEFAESRFRAALELAKKLTHGLTLDFTAAFALHGLESEHVNSNGCQCAVILSLSTTAPVPSISIDRIVLSIAGTAGAVPPNLKLATTRPVIIGKESIRVPLFTTVVTSGYYYASALEVSIGSLCFMHDLSASVVMKKPILIYPSASAPKIRAQQSRFRDLAGSPLVLIEISSSQSPLLELSLQLKPASAGLRLRALDSRLLNNEDEIELTAGSALKLNKIPRQSTVSLVLPYNVENADASELRIKGVLSYTQDNVVFTLYETLHLSSILPINVNVQDTFIESGLFSRFTLTSATLVPLRLTECKIYGFEDGVIDCHSPPLLDDIDVFPKQPISWLCRFESHQRANSQHRQTPLRLQVSFVSIDEAILSTIENQFLNDIAQSPCLMLSKLLCNHLLDFYRDNWTEKDLEGTCIMRQVDVWPFLRLSWHRLLYSLPPALRRTASRWLQDWHSTHATLPLIFSSGLTRRISIPVDLPTPHIFATISLRLRQPMIHAKALSMGKPCEFDLGISLRQERGVDSEIEIVYEIVPSLENWLVGGKRRGTLRLGMKRTESVPLILVPQRPGNLMSPSIEFKAFALNYSIMSASARPTREEVSCEFDYQDHATFFFVTSNGRTTSGLAFPVDAGDDYETMTGRQHQPAEVSQGQGLPIGSQ